MNGSNEVTVWWDEPADGPVNMAADECLAMEAERRGGVVMRFYGWSSTTVSLGGFQSLADADKIEEIRGLPVVRRPSGGGAIIHGSDLTYAVAVPRTHPWGGRPQALVDAMHGTLAEVLMERGVHARPHVPTTAAASPRTVEEAPFFCFDRRAAGDLVIAARHGIGSTSEAAPAHHDAKIMGSAQRRLSAAVLQHGTLLLAGNADLRGRARHPGVADLLPRSSLSAADVASAWAARVAGRLGAALLDQGDSFLSLVESLVAARAHRFRDPRWTGRR